MFIGFKVDGELYKLLKDQAEQEGKNLSEKIREYLPKTKKNYEPLK
jgi:predicted CopG family antitoxin